MSRSDRLFRLLDALRRLPSPVTASTLARETEVSERTIYRDIETLRASGALIDGEAGYGYSLTEDSALPPQSFDRIEIEALNIAIGWLHWHGDAELADAGARALDKITATLPPRKRAEAQHVALMSHSFQPRTGLPTILPQLREAIWAEAVVKIGYTDRNDVRTQRDIWPLAIYYTDFGLWLMAWCALRQDFRRFRISLIDQLAETQGSFRPRRAALLREMLDQQSRMN